MSGSLCSGGFWTTQFENEFPPQARVSGYLWILIWSVWQLQLKVQRCPMPPTQPICIKYQDENNDILGVDTSELRFRCPWTEQFKSHVHWGPSLTHLTMWGRGRTRTLYKDPALDRQTNITENITFVTPLEGSKYFVDKFRNLTLQKLPDIGLDVRLNWMNTRSPDRSQTHPEQFADKKNKLLDNALDKAMRTFFFQYWRQSNLDLQTDIFEDKNLKLTLQKLLYNGLVNSTGVDPVRLF